MARERSERGAAARSAALPAHPAPCSLPALPPARAEARAQGTLAVPPLEHQMSRLGLAEADPKAIQSVAKAQAKGLELTLVGPGGAGLQGRLVRSGCHKPARE